MRERLPFLKVPIILAPIAGPGTPELTAAVCNAGAFAFLACPYLDPERIAREAARVRELTDKPFGLNLFVEPKLPDVDAVEIQTAHERLRVYREVLQIEHPERPATPPDHYEAQLEAVLRERPAAFSFTFGIPERAVIEAFRDAGIFTVGTATSVREAEMLEEAGVDAVCAQGAEAGGHRGTFAHDISAGLIGTIALVPQIVDAVSLPVIAAGGIMDGRGIAAVIALGASAAQLGTAFLLATEAATSRAYREALQDRSSTETVLTRVFSGRTARGIHNRFIAEMNPDADVAPYPYQNALTRDIRNAAARLARGEFLSLWAGQGYPLARTGPAGEIVADLIEEMHEAARDVGDFCRTD